MRSQCRHGFIFSVVGQLNDRMEFWCILWADPDSKPLLPSLLYDGSIKGFIMIQVTHCS
jgi:hypothetical protein